MDNLGLMFSAAAFRAALEEVPAFRYAWRSLLAKEVRRLRTQCERLSLHSAVERITHYIESEGNDGIAMLEQSRKSWATELGLTHEALYRALRRMQDEGALEVNVGSSPSLVIVQNDEPPLEANACSRPAKLVLRCLRKKAGGC